MIFINNRVPNHHYQTFCDISNKIFLMAISFALVVLFILGDNRIFQFKKIDCKHNKLNNRNLTPPGLDSKFLLKSSTKIFSAFEKLFYLLVKIKKKFYPEMEINAVLTHPI